MISRWLMALFIALPAATAETESGCANFGGPDSVPNQIESDALDALMGWGTAQGERWDAISARRLLGGWRLAAVEIGQQCRQ